MATSDLLLTGARLYYAPVGEARPDANTIGSGTAWGGNWVDMGTISQALALTVEETRHAFKDQRYLSAVKEIRKEMIFKFSSALGEINANNVALVDGFVPADTVTTTAPGASQIGHEIVSLGSANGCVRSVPEWALGAEGKLCTADGDSAWMRVYLTKGTFMRNGDMVLDSDGDGTLLPFMFTGLVDEAQAGGIPYIYERMTAVATS